MIVNEGILQLLDEQDTYLSSLVFGLFVSNTTISATTVIGDLTLASWSGYSNAAVGSLYPSTIVGPRAQTSPVSQPVFTNGSGSPVTFYGWFLYDPTASKLVAAVNLGLRTIPAGETYALVATFTDRQE